MSELRPLKPGLLSFNQRASPSTHMSTHKHTVSHDLGHINSPSETLIRPSISVDSFDSQHDVANEGAVMHALTHAVRRGAKPTEVH